MQLNLRGDLGGTEANDSVAAVQRIVDSVPPPPGIKAYVTGPGPLATDRRVYGDEGAKKITLVTLAVIAVMLLLVYRSFFTTVILFFTIGIELLAARGVIAVLGQQQHPWPVHFCGQSTHRAGDCGLDGLRDFLGGPISGGQIAGTGS